LAGSENAIQRLEIELLRAELETRRSTHSKAVEILKPALEEARSLGHEVLQANLLGQLGRIAYWQRETESSERYLKEALSIARKSNDKPTLVFTLRQYGNLTYRSDTETARRSFQESIALAREIGDRRSEATGLNSLGNLLSYLDDLQTAIECYEPAGKIFRELGDKNSECMVLGNLSFLHTELGDLESGEREAKASLAINRETGALQFRSAAQISLANIYMRSGRNSESRKFIDLAVATTQEIGERLLYAPFMYGILKIRRGDRATGLAWIGFTRAHEKEFQKEIARDIKRMWDEIRGDQSEEAVDAAMRLGESLKFEEILAEAAREGF
jgi:tetratricopeptide (TPR) repeat protein